jgi:hypothetical protein
MSDQKSSIYDRVTAAAALASVVLSGLAVAVTLHVAYVQDRNTELQSQYSHALGYADIYFSDPVSSARDTVDSTYFDAYPKIKSSQDPNAEVARLLVTAPQQLSFDRLIALYDQIGACAITKICNADVTTRLYGRDIKALFQNWYGYIVARRALLRASDYGCQLALFLGQNYQPPDPGCAQ